MMRALAFALLLAGCASLPEEGPAPDMAIQTRALSSQALFGAPQPQPTQVPNAQIVQDILELGFQLESGRKIEQLSRFEGPVTLRLTGSPPPLAATETDRLLARLRREAGLDIRRQTGPANITVEFVPRATMRRTVPEASCFVVPSITSWTEFRAALRGPGLDWAETVERDRVLVVAPADATVQEMRDCLHEEIGQALGPLNDLYRIAGTVWNDDNFQTTLTGYDMLVLRVWNDPALQSGMAKAEVARRLPAILARLNPRGQTGAASAPSPTGRDWVQAIENALSSPRPAASYRSAARALGLAVEAGWADARLAFSLFLVARFAPPARGAEAFEALLQASRLYGSLPDGAKAQAYVDLHIAAQALGAKQYSTVLALTARAMTAARRAENGALLSSLMLLRAQALAAQGNTSEAARLRRDATPFALYGFGSDKAATARRDEIALLAAP
ncbi:MAG: Protein of unknown function (DUF2927) [Roseibaca calidilacus]|uniref:DUF2927 domain-containing protein n=1 Tax=Roseibaca calidilacus TaxID=1666912 RepID=A0A0N8K7H0_9RHOB|nr:DUF2927 domain-containing protein [Roseibaca calidilacus]KPP91713.1 MAG: Protein of unknown function (DUF2927) [Roseibaca calidilacus]CUX82643.1 Protein of unknown function (DUF2927) [Roseibaca calidilacus]